MINLLKYLLFTGILLSRPALSAGADCFTFMEPASDSSVDSDSYFHVHTEHRDVPCQTVTTQTDTHYFGHTSAQTDLKISLHICIKSGPQTELTDRITDESATEKSPLELIADKITKLIAKKTRDISSQKTLTEHAYALLLTMGNFNNNAASVIEIASWHTIMNAPWAVAGSAAWYAAQYAAWIPTMKLSEDTSTKAVWSRTVSAITSGVKSKLHLTRKNWTAAGSYGKFVSQLSEEETLAYLSNGKDINAIFNVLFDTALSAVKDEELIHSASSIFRSQDVWNKFKETHFGKLTDEAKIYLAPWLSQLDKLVDMSS